MLNANDGPAAGTSTIYDGEALIAARVSWPQSNCALMWVSSFQSVTIFMSSLS